MTVPVSMVDAIRAAVLYQLGLVNTCLPAQIVSYDFSKQKATVQPVLNKVYSDGTTVEMPILENVPVIFPRAGGASLTFPVVSGDTCLLVFSQRSIDLWLSTGGIVSPDDPRKFDLSDAIAIMGLIPFSDTSYADNNSDLLLFYKNSKIRIKDNSDIVIETANKIALGNDTTEVLEVISQLLQILITSITASVGSPIQQVPIPPSTYSYTSLKAQVDALRGSI